MNKKEQETITIRPKIKLTPSEIRRLQRIASITGFSISQFVKNQVKFALGVNEPKK